MRNPFKQLIPYILKRPQDSVVRACIGEFFKKNSIAYEFYDIHAIQPVVVGHKLIVFIYTGKPVEFTGRGNMFSNKLKDFISKTLLYTEVDLHIIRDDLFS